MQKVLAAEAPLTRNPLRFHREERDLNKLSELGHFLKGSSATLGLVKVRDHCEKIQRYGKKENVDGSPEPNEVKCLERITETVKALKLDFFDIEAKLKAYFSPR